MRRFAAAFSRRDKEQGTLAPGPLSQQPPSSPVAPTSAKASLLEAPTQPTTRKSSFFSKAPQKPLEPVRYDDTSMQTPPLATPTSSASSDASSSLRIPDEGEELPLAPIAVTVSRTQSRWKSFLRRNKSGTAITPSPAIVSTQDRDIDSTAHKDASRSARSLPRKLVLSPHNHARAVGYSDSEDSDNDDDDDDESDGERYNSPSAKTPVSAGMTTPTRPVLPIVVDPVLAARSQSNLRSIVQTALDFTPPAPHPLLTPIGHSFPRSSNMARMLDQSPKPAPMETTLHRTRMLQRLDARNLSASEQASILPFRFKSAQSRNSPSRDVEAVLDQKKLLGWSRGVGDWLKRPTFEQRAVLWSMHTDEFLDVPVLRSAPIQGSSLAVAELEFSDGLLALASSEATVAAYAPRKPAESAGGVRRNTSIRRNVLAAAAARAKASKSAAEGGEDDVPLGVMVKLRREQTERKRVAEEQKRREQEEKLRAVEEARQRAAREEERQRRVYAEEVAAARMRRERERQGTHGRGDPFNTDRGPPPPRRSPSESTSSPTTPSGTPPPSGDARADRSKRRSGSFTPRQRLDSTMSRDDRPAAAAPTRTPPARQSTLPDARRMSTVSINSTTSEVKRTKQERRTSSVSESSARSGFGSNTLPRSFRSGSGFMPPPVPTLHRQPSQPQMSQGIQHPQQIPVFVPVFIPQPVTPPWGVDFGQMMGQEGTPSLYSRRSGAGSRVSVATTAPIVASQVPKLTIQ